MRLTLPALLFCARFCLAQVPPDQDPRAYFQDGEKALSEARYRDAENDYRQLSRLDPSSPEVHAKLGMILFQEGKFEQALPELQHALKLKPSLSEASTLLAMSLSELGRFKDALPLLEKGFRRSASGPLKRSAGLQLERAYTGLQFDDKAVELGLELNRLYPDDPEILYQTGRIFGNFAYLTMMKLSKAPANSTWRHQAAGEAFESQGSYDLAIVEYRNVLSIEPNRPGIHYRLARALLAKSQSSDASHEFELELQRDPSNGNAAYELGEIDRKAGRLNEARGHFELALQSDPDFEEAQLGLGRTLVASNEPALAIAHLAKAAELNPRNELAYFQLAKANAALGRIDAQEKALAEYQRLRARKAEQEIGEISAQREVTKQTFDPTTDQ